MSLEAESLLAAPGYEAAMPAPTLEADAKRMLDQTGQNAEQKLARQIQNGESEQALPSLVHGEDCLQCLESIPLFRRCLVDQP